MPILRDDVKEIIHQLRLRAVRVDLGGIRRGVDVSPRDNRALDRPA
jgi:hypothetical protein